MILVNVSKSWTSTTGDVQHLDMLEGAWPLYNPVPADASVIAAAQAVLDDPHGDHPNWARDYAQVLAHDDYLVGVARNEVVAVRRIVRVGLPASGERIVFVTVEAPEVGHAVGKRLPKDLAWHRGQGWPIKYVSSQWLHTVATAEHFDIGDYSVTLAPDGSALYVTPPHDGSVVVGGSGYDPGLVLAHTAGAGFSPTTAQRIGGAPVPEQVATQMSDAAQVARTHALFQAHGL